MTIDQNKLLVPGIIVLGVILLLLGNVWAINTFSFKVATFDINTISKDSQLGQDLKKDVENKYNELKARNDLAKSDVEKNNIKNEFSQFQAQKEAEFTDRVQKAVAKVAKAKGIKAVASPQVFIYSENDISNDIIKELAK